MTIAYLQSKQALKVICYHKKVAETLSFHHPFLHPDPITMPSPAPKLPLDLLLIIAHHIRDAHGKLRYGDFNSFLQVNRVLHACLNRMLWKEAGKHTAGTQRVYMHLFRTNNLAGLELFLELGADVEFRLPAFQINGLIDGEWFDEDVETTPLLLAADWDNVPFARLLLENGACVQYFCRFNTGKFGPIHAARSAAMVQLLLDHNADPNLDDHICRRPLHWYAIRGNIAAMRAILQHGAEVNRREPFGTPLHEAARRNLAAVELLVDHGADVKAMDCNTYTPLHLAAKAGKLDVVKFLVERWPAGIRGRDNFWLNTPLHLAARAGKIDVVKFLVEQWPEATREKNRVGATPLDLASKLEVVWFLVEIWAARTRRLIGGFALRVFDLFWGKPRETALVRPSL
jgi:ankyrin repeat protein